MSEAESKRLTIIDPDGSVHTLIFKHGEDGLANDSESSIPPLLPLAGGVAVEASVDCKLTVD